MSANGVYRLEHLCLGTARRVAMHGRSVLTGMGKRPVNGPIALQRLGLAGDEQADLSVHGGLDKAVYAYPVEHAAFWQAALDEHAPGLLPSVLPPGGLGENLAITGLLESDVWIGDRLHFPDAVLRVTAPREPCYKLAAWLGLPQAGRLMLEQRCPGFYLAVERTGSLCAGQAFSLEPGPRALSVLDAFWAKRLKHLR